MWAGCFAQVGNFDNFPCEIEKSLCIIVDEKAKCLEYNYNNLGMYTCRNWEGSKYGGMNESQNSVVSVIHSPMKGEVCPLEEVPDPAFAQRFLGDGVAIIPEDSEVCAPAKGKIVSVFETKHAIVFQNEQNVRVLLHVGIGSMRLKGKGFEAYVDSGQNVEEGDKLLSLDLRYLAKRAETLASPLVMTNNRNRYKIRVIAKGHIEVGDPLFEVVEISA